MNYNVKFKLKNSNATSTLINLFIFSKAFQGGQFKVSTERSINPQLWNREIQRPIINWFPKDNEGKNLKKKILKDIDVHYKNELVEIGNRLDTISSSIIKLINQYQTADTTITKDLIKSEYSKIFKQKNNNLKKDDPNFIENYWSTFITQIETGKRTVNGTSKKYEHGTIKTYKGALVQLKDFQKCVSEKYTFTSFNNDEYQKLITFLNEKDYTIDTIGKIIARIKFMFKCAEREGLKINSDYKQFKASKNHNIKNITLTQNEVDAIYKLEGLTEPLERIRDIFVVGCYTAQRISDYGRIKPQNIVNIDGVNYLKIIQKKTSTEVTVPISNQCWQILTKYNLKLPQISEQKINAGIKQLGKLAGINSIVIVERLKGGEKVKTEHPKYELIVSHTARRTGATLMYDAKISTLEIMKFTGHKKESNFLKYINVEAETVAKRNANNSFFTRKLQS